MKLKQTITIIFAIILLTTTGKIYSQTPSPSVNPKTATSTPKKEINDEIDKLKQIESFKEKIATKVSEIRDKEKKAIYGNVVKKDKNSLNLKTNNGEKTISILEDALFFTLKKETKTESSFDKVNVNDNAVVFGYYNKDQDLFSSKYIYITSLPERITGKISDIDKKAYTITVKGRDGEKIIDIESLTKMSLIDKEMKIVKGGFSKFSTGDSVHITADKNAKEENRFIGLRILTIPKYESISPTPSKEISPSPNSVN